MSSGTNNPTSYELIISRKSKSDTDLISKLCFDTVKGRTLSSSLTNSNRLRFSLECVHLDHSNESTEERLLLKKSVSLPTFHRTKYNQERNEQEIDVCDKNDTQIETTEANKERNLEKINCSLDKRVESIFKATDEEAQKLDILEEKLETLEINLLQQSLDLEVEGEPETTLFKMLEYSLHSKLDMHVKMNAKITNLQSKITALEEQADSDNKIYQCEKANYKKNEVDLMIQQASLENQVSEGEIKQEKLRKTIRDLHTQLKILTEKNNVLYVENKLLEEDKHRISKQNESLCSENNSLQEKLQNTENVTNSLEADNCLLKTKLQSAKDDLKLEKSAYIKCLQSLEADRKQMACQFNLQKDSLISKNQGVSESAKNMRENLRLKEKELIEAKQQLSELEMKYNAATKELQNIKSQACTNFAKLTEKIYDLEAYVHNNTATDETNDAVESYRTHCDYLTNKIKRIEREKQKLQAQALDRSHDQHKINLENENAALKQKYDKWKTAAQRRLDEIKLLKSRFGYDPTQGRSTD